MPQAARLDVRRHAVKGDVPDRPALHALLAEHFGFDLPEVETVRVPAIPAWDWPHPSSTKEGKGRVIRR